MACGLVYMKGGGVQEMEYTLNNMGLIALPGMIGTEKTIVEIFEDKLK